MSFECDTISANRSLSETLKKLFEGFEYESDTEETMIFVESVPVPSNNILAVDLRATVCNKRKRQEPGDTSGKKMRLMESGEVTDSESEGVDTTTFVGEAAPMPSNNITTAELRRSLNNKRKRQELGDTPEKRMRQVGPNKVNSINGGGDVKHTQTVMPGPHVLDG